MIVKELTKPGPLLSLQETKHIKAGLVVLNPGEEVGKHKTADREEVILVLEGEVILRCEGEAETIVGSNRLAYVSPNKEHNIINSGPSVAKYVYVVNLLNH